MKNSSVLTKDHIFVNDIPSEQLSKRNGLRLVSIGKIFHAFEKRACSMRMEMSWMVY